MRCGIARLHRAEPSTTRDFDTCPDDPAVYCLLMSGRPVLHIGNMQDLIALTCEAEFWPCALLHMPAHEGFANLLFVSSIAIRSSMLAAYSTTRIEVLANELTLLCIGIASLDTLLRVLAATQMQAQLRLLRNRLKDHAVAFRQLPKLLNFVVGNLCLFFNLEVKA